MKLTRIVIVSPNPATAVELAAGLHRVGFEGAPELFSSFPSRNELQPLFDGAEPAAVVLLDYGDERPALQCLRDVRALGPDTLCVMFNGSRRLSSLVKAKQGGAWGYLTDPADLSQLADHFGLSPQPPTEPKTGLLIGFIPAQGGNGASTACLHVAQTISGGGSGQTLLLDCDLHTGTVAFQLGLEPHMTLREALETPDAETIRACAQRWENLDVLVGPADPDGMFRGPMEQMDELLAAARSTYGFVVADLPAPIYSSTTGILRAADRIYLVCTPEITSLHLAKRKIERMQSLGVPTGKLRLLLNRSGSNRGVGPAQIEKITGVAVEWALDNDYQAVSEAAMRGGLLPPDTALAQQLEHLGEQIVTEFGATPKQAATPQEPVEVG